MLAPVARVARLPTLDYGLATYRVSRASIHVSRECERVAQRPPNQSLSLPGSGGPERASSGHRKQRSAPCRALLLSTENAGDGRLLRRLRRSSLRRIFRYVSLVASSPACTRPSAAFSPEVESYSRHGGCERVAGVREFRD